MKTLLLASLFVIPGLLFASIDDSFCSKIVYYNLNIAHIGFDKDVATNICDFCADPNLNEYTQACLKISCIEDSIWVIGEENVLDLRTLCTMEALEDSPLYFWSTFLKAVENYDRPIHHW